MGCDEKEGEGGEVHGDIGVEAGIVVWWSRNLKSGLWMRERVVQEIDDGWVRWRLYITVFS